MTDSKHISCSRTNQEEHALYKISFNNTSRLMEVYKIQILLKTFTFGWQGLFSNFFGSRRCLFAATTCILWRFFFSLLGRCCKIVILLFKNIGRMNNFWTEKKLSSLILSDYLNCFYLKTEKIFIGLTINLNKAYVIRQSGILPAYLLYSDNHSNYFNIDEFTFGCSLYFFWWSGFYLKKKNIF